MAALVPVALLGFFPLAFWLFARLPGHRAVVVALVLGVLFLPEVHGYDALSQPLNLGVMKLTKLNAVACAILLASLWRDRARWRSFRPAWFDVPILCWSAAPLLASLANGLGWHDGLSASRDQCLTWSVPYFLGRLYLADLACFRDFAAGFVLGGLAYVPLCLFESRMSPQLHALVYGFAPQDLQQAIRFGGYRPVVFMQHGLAVSLWMTLATLVAAWLWWMGGSPQLRLGDLPAVPLGWGFGALLATAVLCRSTGAMTLGAAGLVALAAVRWFRSPAVLAGLLVLAPAYAALRVTGAWDGRELVEWLGTHFDEERARSLEFRLANEDSLIQKAWERPVFGWGGWGRARVINEETGQDESVIDGLWILALGETGFVGLIGLFGTVLVPAARALRRVPGPLWAHPAFSAAGAAALVLILYMIDCLANAMINPVYVAAAGGLATLTGLPDPRGKPISSCPPDPSRRNI